MGAISLRRLCLVPSLSCCGCSTASDSSVGGVVLCGHRTGEAVFDDAAAIYLPVASPVIFHAW